MKIESKFNVGDLLMHKYATHKGLKREHFTDRATTVIYEVMEVNTQSCYAGTQIFYKSRPLHLEFEISKVDGKEMTKYKSALPGWSPNGEATVLLREDEMKPIPDAIKDEIKAAD